MDFREEYKKSMESNSPDRETIDRMKAAVMAELQNSTQNEVPEKKPLNMRRMYYALGALAACAVIAVSAATILPNINKNNDMISEADSEISSAGADTAFDIAEDENAEVVTMEVTQDKETYAATEEILVDTEDSANDDSFHSWDTDNSADRGNGDNTGWADSIADDIVAPDNIPADPDTTIADIATYEPPDNSNGQDFEDSTAEPWELTSDDGHGNPEAGYDTAEVSDATSDTDYGTDDADDNKSDPCIGELTETEDCTEMTEEECDTGEATDSSENIGRIIFGGKGWITYNGERYNEVNDKNGGGSIMTAYDPINKTYYNVVLNGNKLLVYDMNMYIIGAYIHA